APSVVVDILEGVSVIHQGEAMRKLTVFVAALISTTAGAAQALAENVEVKGPHICCPQCVKAAVGLLKDVDGVSDAKADAKSKTVTFTAKDEKAAQAGFKALVDGGFFGQATCGGKELKIAVPAGEGKANSVSVTKVHVCCGACQKAIKGLFADAKVSFEESGP